MQATIALLENQNRKITFSVRIIFEVNYSSIKRNLFKILLNQTEIRLYLPFSEWFGTKRTAVWFQLNRKMVNTIWFQFDLIRFRKNVSLCSCLRNIFEISLNQTEIRLYLPFFYWFGTKWTSVWFLIIRKMVNTIWFRFDSIRFRKYFSVCINVCDKLVVLGLPKLVNVFV